MLVYRIVHKKYSETLFASGLEGRWNSEGKKVLYTSESVALAYLENMTYRKGFGFNQDFRIMVIKLPQNARFQEIKTADLPNNWRDFRNFKECQRFGNLWFDDAEFLGLKVPSAVIPENNNVVINTSHKDFKKVKLIDTLDFVPDERLETIIKNHQ